MTLLVLIIASCAALMMGGYISRRRMNQKMAATQIAIRDARNRRQRRGGR